MLTIKEEKNSEQESVEMDVYIPFSAKFGTDEVSPIYWRGGDGKLSLVEIGLKEDGEICSVTLTSINQKNVALSDRALPNGAIEKEGLPVFDTTGWPCDLKDFSDRFQDEFDSEAMLTIGRDYISLAFSKAGNPVRYIRNERVRFGIASNGDLASIDLTELTQSQIELVKSAI